MHAAARPATPTSPRVVIVDADRRVQQSLSDLLGLTGRVSVVGRASDVRAALEEIERQTPDVVLLDPRLPDIEAGTALIAGMQRAWPSMKVVLTGWSDVEGHAALDGARACYVSKGGTPEEFVAALLDACCPA
jgi:DNA-binding NarL/FixJ family response regulator